MAVMGVGGGGWVGGEGRPAERWNATERDARPLSSLYGGTGMIRGREGKRLQLKAEDEIVLVVALYRGPLKRHGFARGQRAVAPGLGRGWVRVAMRPRRPG